MNAQHDTSEADRRRTRAVLVAHLALAAGLLAALAVSAAGVDAAGPLFALGR